MTKSALTILAVTSTLVLGGMVEANAITASYDFTASGFTPSGISPVDPWTGSFTVTFDPTGGFQEGGLDAFSSNLPASYDTFTFQYYGPQIGELCLLDSSTLCVNTAGENNAVVVFFVTASGGLSFDGALVSTTSATRNALTTSGTVTQTPIPATLPLFATGIGGLGLLGWRRRRKARAAAA
jgi:hypothetical protein